MLDSSSTLVQPDPDAIGPFSLQLLFGVLYRTWLMRYSRSRLKPPVHSRISITPNIAPQGRCLDEVNSVQLSLGGPCVCALYSPYEVLLLRATVKSMYQTGSNNSHLDRDLLEVGHPFSIRHLSFVVPFFLLVLYCCCYYHLEAMRPLDSPIVHHDVVLDAQEEIVIEWEFHRRQQLIRITPLLASIGTGWKNARKIQRVSKALRLQVELPGLHSELGPYWTRFVYRERRLGRRYMPGRLKPP